jgi:hypothetical protein
MPLNGEAKREWQRNYMRAKRRAESPQAEAIAKVMRDALGTQRRGRPAAIPAEAIAEGQAVLQAVLRETGLDIKTLVIKIAEQLQAQRPYGKEAILSADNDAQLRACELAIKLHERAGTIPAITEAPQSQGHGYVRMLQIDPDGTERMIEIGG